MKEIPLSKGYVALVDDDDYERAAQYKWCAKVGNKSRTVYAYRSKGSPTERGKGIFLHNFILGAGSTVQVDHRDMNGLNCQRFNLRVCTNQQNQCNRAAQSNNASGFKGVRRGRWKKGWQAEIRVNGRGIYLGTFDDLRDAARAYNRAARHHFGEFARINEGVE